MVWESPLQSNQLTWLLAGDKAPAVLEWGEGSLISCIPSILSLPGRLRMVTIGDRGHQLSASCPQTFALLWLAFQSLFSGGKFIWLSFLANCALHASTSGL